MARQLADRYSIAGVYDDPGRMLSEVTPDVVHVTTPPQSHLELATRALDAGCHVFVEKPFTVDAGEATRLLERVRMSGKKLTVGHIYQFEPPARDVRRLIARGSIGDPVHIESYYGYSLEGTFGQAIMGSPRHWVHELPGNLLHNNLSHALSKVTEYMPDADPRLAVLSQKGVAGRFGDVRDEVVDELRVALMGADVSAYVTFTSRVRPVGHFLSVYGTRGIVHVDYTLRTVTLVRGAKLPSVIGRILPAFAQSADYFRAGAKNTWRFARAEFHTLAGMDALVKLFYRSILDDADPPIPYDDILRVATIMDRVFAQL
jgi:predicted dehydrogenase